MGIRLNKQPPAITVKKKERGGLNLAMSCKLTHMDEESITGILKEYRILSAECAPPARPAPLSRMSAARTHHSRLCVQLVRTHHLSLHAGKARAAPALTQLVHTSPQCPYQLRRDAR